MGDLTRFGVSLEEDLLADFDALCKKRGYANRSEALRHCIRRELAEDAQNAPGAEVAGVLTLLYDHHEHDLSGKLNTIQHEAHDVVLAAMHVHLDHDHCLEVLALRGAAHAVRAMADKLRSTSGVMQSSVSLAALEHGHKNHPHQHQD